MNTANKIPLRRMIFAAALCMALAWTAASAQEIPTRAQSASLQVFGLFSYVQPHYDPASNMGGSLGADLNLRPLYTFQPSLEVRATFAPGSDVSETTYNVGPRLEADLGRLRPYITLLIGTGNINFMHPLITPTGPYTHDNSIIYSGAIGADYMLTRQIAVRGDIMLQSWDLGNTPSTSAPFHPRLFSFGVDYRFDFNAMSLHRHRD